jgi:hypothetical protein
VILLNNFLTAVGGNVQVRSTAVNTSAIDLRSGNSITALGGNISILTKGGVLATGANIYQAEGITGTANGGIEFGAGTTTSTLNAAFSKPAGTVPSPLTLLGPNVTASDILNNSNQSGVVLVNSKNNGTVNLNFQSSTPTLTLNNGAIVFDVDGAKGYAVNLAGGTFTTSSSKPISGVSLDNIDEVIVDTEFDY